MKFRVIDGCPCPEDIAPYVYLVLRKAGQSASSIYRGDDAKAILHAHGKHTQREIHAAMPAISNPPGFSQHELRSDGVGNPKVPRGGKLEFWQVGIDSGTDSEKDKEAVRRAAVHFGWQIKHPYSRGVEGHHWCFALRPEPRNEGQRAELVSLRKRLAKR